MPVVNRPDAWQGCVCWILAHLMKAPKLPKPKKMRRNPFARALGSPLYRSRVVKQPGTYLRRPKHRKVAEAEGEE